MREHGHGKRTGTKVETGLTGGNHAVHASGDCLVPALLLLVVNAALAVVIAIGDHKGNVSLDHGRANLPHHRAGALCALAQRELDCVTLYLITGEHHEVWLRLVERRTEKRRRVVSHVRGLLDVRELQHAETSLKVKSQRPRVLVRLVNHMFLLWCGIKLPGEKNPATAAPMPCLRQAVRTSRNAGRRP